MVSVRVFSDLFKGNRRSFGEFNSKSVKSQMQTHKREYVENNFESHFKGELGIGIVPILDDGNCWWGAIDIDNHGSSEDLDLVAIETKVKELGLPLVPCRSKSGGAHLYLFSSEPLRADIVKGLLTRWMTELGIEGSDCVFPKQAKLVLDGDGNRPLGNWINLPYFGGDNTDRYAIESGVKLSFDQFVKLANDKSINNEILQSYFSKEHDGAPPCIKMALQEKIMSGNGQRNDALFHITVYNRKRDAQQARELSHEMMPEVFDEPITFFEADRTIKSAAKKSYGYMCSKEPWKGWCDKEACRKARYGISESEFETLTAESKLPEFTDLVKYINTDPVMWELKMGGIPMILSSNELMDYKTIRMMAMEKLHVVLPSKISQTVWTDKMLAELMNNVRFEEAPLGVSLTSVLELRMHEFLRKANLDSNGKDHKDRDALLRGVPVVQDHQGELVVMFRSVDYEDYLKKTRTEIPRNRNIWYSANKQMGVDFIKTRVRGNVMSVWTIPLYKVKLDKPQDIDVSPEF